MKWSARFFVFQFFILYQFLISWVANAAPLSFEEAVKEILARDTQVHIADANRRAITGQNFYTRFHLLPKISLEGLSGSNYPNQHLSSITGTAQFGIFKFGADLAALDAAKAKEDASSFAMDQTILTEESIAVSSLVAWIRLQLENAVLVKLEKLQADSVEVANRQYHGGRAPLQEVQKAEVDLENVRARIGEAKINLDNAQQELIRLLGNAEVQIVWPWKEKIKALDHLDTMQAKDYFAQRPDLKTATAQLEAQDRLKTQSYRQLFPELDAKIGYGYSRDTAIGNNYIGGWSALLLLEIPLFNRFTDESNYRYQSALRNQTEFVREEVFRKIDAEFNSIPKRFLTARQTAIARENILQISNHLYEDNLSRFRLGRASSNELNIDLNRFLETELNAISGWALAHLAYTDLAHLTGKSALQ